MTALELDRSYSLNTSGGPPDSVPWCTEVTGFCQHAWSVLQFFLIKVDFFLKDMFTVTIY